MQIHEIEFMIDNLTDSWDWVYVANSGDWIYVLRQSHEFMRLNLCYDNLMNLQI